MRLVLDTKMVTSVSDVVGSRKLSDSEHGPLAEGFDADRDPFDRIIANILW